MTTTLYRKLAVLTDEDAERCLNGLLHGLTIETPDYSRLLESTADMETVLQAAGVPDKLRTLTPADRSRAIRILLTELADHDKFGPELEAWIEGERETMLVPLAVPLVLAGIVLVLSIDINVEYRIEDGKKKFAFELKKSSTSEKILGKFFGLFD